MPGGAGTPGGYDGGSGSGSSADGTGAAYQDRIQQIAAQNRAAAASRATARERAIQLAALTPKTIEPVRSPHSNTPTQIAEQKEIDLYGYQDAKAKAPTTLEPKIPKLIFSGNPHLDNYHYYQPQKYSSTYYQDRSKIGGETYGERAEAGIKRGGIGTTLKNVALGVLAPQLLAGTKFGTGLNIYNKYQQAKRYVPKIGDIETALKSKLTNNFIGTGDNRFATQNQNKKRTFNEPTRDGNNVQRVSTGKDVVTESIKKYTGISDTQKAEAFKRKNTVENILRQGSYQGKKLTNQQKSTLTNYVSQITKYLNMNTMGV